MENIVYFLGAGFSQPLGLPISSNFIEKSKDLYFYDQTKYAHFKEVIDTIIQLSNIKNYLTANLANIEEVLSILEMKLSIDDQKSRKIFSKYICDVINAFTPSISETPITSERWCDKIFITPIFRKYGWFVLALLTGSIYEVILPPENRLILRYQKGDAKRQYSVITLNYDCVLEGFISYLSRQVQEEEFVGFVTSLDIPGTPLIKLHGSAADGNIIPPTWNKSLEPTILNSWKNAYNIISKANQIRFIGYSLPETDAYIRYLLKSSINEAKHLKRIDVIVLDRSTETQIIQRFKDFIVFPSFRVRNANVEQYLDGLSDLIKNDYMKRMSRGMQGASPFLEEMHEIFMEIK